MVREKLKAAEKVTALLADAVDVINCLQLSLHS
jgi:hypothetical protein